LAQVALPGVTVREGTAAPRPAHRTVVAAPIDGPFGRTFTFADPDGYRITLHDRS
jgi:predicted enzyme related to lactoylglutathione lyase